MPHLRGLDQEGIKPTHGGSMGKEGTMDERTQKQIEDLWLMAFDGGMSHQAGTLMTPVEMFKAEWIGLVKANFVSNEGVFNKEFAEVRTALEKALIKFPTWPTDPIHASKVLDEEVGELSKAVLQAAYEPEKNELDAVRKEALHAAAMAIRFLASLGVYEYRPSEQHWQK